MILPFFTIGHSTRSIEEFIALLEGAGVDLVVDIRTIPRSRTNPQFNQDTLSEALAKIQVSYEHVAALGGLRGRANAVSQDVNDFWTNERFHNYADYALSEHFQAGFEYLLELGRGRRCSIMCSEAVWWRCHRRIVVDYLIARGNSVFHIMGRDRFELANLTAGAVVRLDGTVNYPSPNAHRHGTQQPAKCSPYL